MADSMMQVSRLGSWNAVRVRMEASTARPASRPPVTWTPDAYRPMPGGTPRPGRPAPRSPDGPTIAHVPSPVPQPVAPKPVAPAAPASAIDSLRLRAGQTLQLAAGTTVKGFEVTGTAKVVSVSGKHVELRMQGNAGGMMAFDVKFRAEVKPDGSLRLDANMLEGGRPTQNLLGQNAQILSSKSGVVQLRTEDGKSARLASLGNGGLAVQVDDISLKLQTA